MIVAVEAHVVHMTDFLYIIHHLLVGRMRNGVDSSLVWGAKQDVPWTIGTSVGWKALRNTRLLHSSVEL